jgi:hypothetical protein
MCFQIVVNTKPELTRIADERDGTAVRDEGRGLESGKRPTHATSKRSGASSSAVTTAVRTYTTRHSHGSLDL